MDGLEAFIRIRCGVYVLLWGIGLGKKVKERKRGRQGRKCEKGERKNDQNVYSKQIKNYVIRKISSTLLTHHSSINCHILT